MGLELQITDNGKKENIKTRGVKWVKIESNGQDKLKKVNLTLKNFENAIWKSFNYTIYL